MGEQYSDDLIDRFNKQYKVQEKYKNALEEKVNKTEEAISQYTQLIDENADEEKRVNYIEVLINKEEVAEKYRADLGEAEYDLALAESPELIEVSTVQSSNNLLKNILLAGAFGFQLMLVLLVLWKYIINARRALSERK